MILGEKHNGRGGINKKGNIHPSREVALTIYHDDDHDDDDDDDHHEDADQESNLLRLMTRQTEKAMER